MIINSHAILVGGAEVLLERMDAASADRAVLAGSHEGAILCHSGCTPAGNHDVLSAVEAYPDRFIGCAYINPLDSEAVKHVDDWADAGFKALKFFPADGYFPDDKRLWPIFDKMQVRRLAAVFHMGLADYAFETVPGARHAPNSAFAIPMRLDPVCRLFPGINFLILNMGYPLMIEAWSVHHNSGNIYLHIGGEGTQFSSLATAYTALGGAGFIPLDFSRVLFGSGDAGNIARSVMLAEDSISRMGCVRCKAGKVFNTNAEAFFRL